MTKQGIFRIQCAVMAFALSLAAGQAMASGPGAGSKVYGPEVEKGEAEFEFRGSRFTGGEEGGEGVYVYEASYGITDWWKAALVLETENEPNGPLFVEAVEFENVFELPRIPGVPINFGIYAEYEMNVEGERDGVEMRWLASYENGPFETKFNFNVDREFGSENTFEFGYGSLTTVEVAHDFAIGFEAFGEFGDANSFGALGNREHYMGPVILFEIEPAGLPGELEIQTGYLFGVGDAEADGQVRLLLEWEFDL